MGFLACFSVKPNTFKTFRQFSKWLINRAIKVKRKMDSVVSKAVYEHFKDQMSGKISPPADNEELIGIMEDIERMDKDDYAIKRRVFISEEQLKDTVARTIRKFIREEKKKKENME